MDNSPFLSLPQGMVVEYIEKTASQLTVLVRSMSETSCCPGCGCPSEHIHSHYHRTLNDLPCGGHRVLLRLEVRKFFCLSLCCPRQIFAERFPQLCHPWARITKRLLEALMTLGLAASAEVCERLAPHLGMKVKAPTLLNYLRTIPPPCDVPVSKVGIDDFALRRGDRYGSILVNLETRKPLDLLPDRTSDAVYPWLVRHQEIEIVSRDRANGYADAIKRALPHATQIADRFHLCQNLREHLQTLLDRRHTCLPLLEDPGGSPTLDPPSDEMVKDRTEVSIEAGHAVSPLDEPDPAESLPPSPEPSPSSLEPLKAPPEDHDLNAAERKSAISRDKRYARYEAVQTLHRQGLGQRAIARQLGLSRKAVRRFATCTTFPERATGSGRRLTGPGKLTPYLPYLRQRWDAGTHNASLLFREIQERGYTGSRSLVGHLLAKWRAELPPKPPASPQKRRGQTASKPPRPARQKKAQKNQRRLSSRSAAYLLILPTKKLTETNQRHLEQLCSYEDLKLASTLAQAFMQMVKEHQAEQLPDWLKQAKDSHIPELKSFALGITRDYAAVSAALSLPWSNGVVEGNINRLKFLKRQMFGRAHLDLLRIKVLHAV